MATINVINDVTKPLDTSNWLNVPKKASGSKERLKEAIAKKLEARMESLKKPDSEAMDVDKAKSVTAMETEPNGMVEDKWIEVTRKKGHKTDAPEEIDSAMKKVRMTITIRPPKDATTFSPAKLHLDTLHELHKVDESLLVFNANGDERVNIESNLSEARYKDTFKPVEKRLGRGPAMISISHDVCLTSKASDCKEAIFPFLKKNRIFIYFNPKPGLEHFTAIGVLFGPNPDYIWRDEMAELLIETMKSEITDEECKLIGTTTDGKPKIILSLNIQTIGISKPIETTSVALEIRVPSGLERQYTKIIERLYDKAENEELIIPNKLGKFFPYYMKSKLPEVFTYLMRQQNSEMTETSIIPIFGYSPAARQQSIQVDGETTTVELAIATTPEIIRIEATPSTWNLHKYLVIVKNENKESVQKTIKKIFGQIKNPLENQPANFPVPRCGGRESTPIAENTPENETISSAYMIRLEAFAQAQNPQDAGPSAPPKRPRKFTISYANATKVGIVKQPDSNDAQNKSVVTNDTQATTQESANPNTQRPTDNDGTTEANSSMGSSLSRSIENSKINNVKQVFENEIKEIKADMEQRFSRQEHQLKEIQQCLTNNSIAMETRIAKAVITAMMQEKEKVQIFTHGATYDAKQAPLADDNGQLPYGGTVQAGGPLDRLHHLEVTVQHMTQVLDSIAEHFQKDPNTRYLLEDDDSEDTTIIENTRDDSEDDVDMRMREFSGSKRSHDLDRSPNRKNVPVVSTKSHAQSPTRSPPPKRERANDRKPPANPASTTGSGGET